MSDREVLLMKKDALLRSLQEHDRHIDNLETEIARARKIRAWMLGAAGVTAADAATLRTGQTPRSNGED